MADGNSHPFNNDVIAVETIDQLQKSSSSHQQQEQKQRSLPSKQKNLLDLLASNNTSNHFFNATDPSTNISSQTITDDDFNRLKSIIRTTIWPIDHHIRRQLWINILTLNRVSTSKQHSSSYGPIAPASVTIDYSLNSLSSKLDQWPNFVDTTNLCFYHLTDSTGRIVLQRILFTFALHHPDVTFCPALEPFSALLLHYFDEHEVLYLINRLLMKHWLCGETRLQWEANCNVFKRLLRTYFKSTADAIELRYPNTKLFYQEWFWWIFRYLPFSYLVKILDCFLLEGPKILYRLALALICFPLFALLGSICLSETIFCRPSIYSSKSVKDEPNGSVRNMADFCQQISIPVDQLLRIAFSIRNLKRSTIEQLINHEEKSLHNSRFYSHMEENDQSNSNLNKNNSNNNGSISERQTAFVTPHHLTRIPKTSILDHQQFVTLWNWLPARFSLSQPHLVFTTQQHGFRLQTLLEKIDELEYSILVVRTTNNEIFGAFCAGLWSDRHNKTYFGFGESFLFTLIPKQIKYPWVGQQHDNRQHQVKRELFLFVTHEKLIIGGGNGDGLCIDSSLCEGRTGHCETFNNDPLCSSPYFSISDLEMLTFDFSSS